MEPKTIKVALNIESGQYQVSEEKLEELSRKISTLVPVSEFVPGVVVACCGYALSFTGKVIRVEANNEIVVIGLATIIDVEGSQPIIHKLN